MPEFSYNCRIATQEDLQGLQEVNKSLDRNALDKFLLVPIKEEQVIVAVSKGIILGYLLYSYLWDEGSVLIQIIRIKKEYQRLGIGTALIGMLETMLNEQGFSQLISSTEKTNTNSLAFHKNSGFVECGELDINPNATLEVFLKKKIA